MELFFEEQNKAERSSIYSLIFNAMNQEGRLPLGFRLPDDTPENQIKYAPGAKDGIGVFYIAERDTQKDAKTLAKLIKKACRDFDPYIQEKIRIFLAEHTVVSLIDQLCGLLISGEIIVEKEKLFTISYDLMTKATDEESVKLGIAFMGLLNVEKNEDCRKIILTLGKYDEFTLFAVVAAMRWSDGNDQIFYLAKETHGWGKIHSVRRLEPVTEEIRDWIICHGCKCSVMDAYLGLECAQKADLLSYLKQDDLSDNILQGINVIFKAMLDERQVSGISQYEDAQAAIDRYLYHADKSESLEVLHTVSMLQNWLKNSDIADKDNLMQQCIAICQKPLWHDVLLDNIKNDEQSSLWQSCNMACLNVLLQGLREYPGKGMALIKTGLRSPVVSNRNMACHVLEAWAESPENKLADFDGEITDIIQTVYDQEVDSNIKERLKKLLN
jgi:hypothetical protein